MSDCRCPDFISFGLQKSGTTAIETALWAAYRIEGLHKRKDLVLGSDVLGTHDWVLYGPDILHERYWGMSEQEIKYMLCQSFKVLDSDL